MCEELWRAGLVVPHFPAVGQGRVVCSEVDEAAGKAAPDVGDRNIVPALYHAPINGRAGSLSCAEEFASGFAGSLRHGAAQAGCGGDRVKGGPWDSAVEFLKPPDRVARPRGNPPA